MNSKFSLRRFVSSLALSALLLFPVACAKTLNPGGAYNPTVVSDQTAPYMTDGGDVALYNADRAYMAVRNVVFISSEWEANNRVVLWGLDRGIKRTLDNVRREWAKYDKDYFIARSQYIEARKQGIENREPLDQAVIALERLSQTAWEIYLRHNPSATQ
jgi:hypothetical protein